MVTQQQFQKAIDHMKVFKVRYQHKWMKDINPGLYKNIFIHACSINDPCIPSAKHMGLQKTGFYEVVESSIKEEIKDMLVEGIVVEDLPDIPDYLLDNIINAVRDVQK